MKREFFVFCAALLLFCGSFAAVSATSAARDFALRGYVDPTQTTDLPYRLPRLGVNADLLQYTEAELRQQLDRMQQANITWVRQFAYWDALEPVAGNYQWAAWDQLTAVLAEYPQLRLVVVFMNSPQWARPARLNESPTAPPDDPQTFAAFVREFALRYQNQIDHYQIWDEPNLDDAWGLSDPQPAEYVALLQSAYSAIHSADAGATVLLAALAPTTETGGQNISDWLYLEDLYALGAAPYFDSAAAKPYGFDLPPTDRTVEPTVLNFSRIVALREIMVQHGDGKKALWASNVGWNSLPADWQGSPSIWGQVSQAEQTDYTLAALARAEREWAWLGGFILYHWQPNAPQNDPLWGYALVDQQNAPSPLLQALGKLPPAVARNGVFHPMTPFARYSGVWTFSERGADIGWLETSDSQLEFDFSGQDVALWLREGNYVAFLYPTIDGESANATPRDSSGNAYIFLQSASSKPELNAVPVAHQLASGSHTLHIIADKGWDQWALAGYAVSDGNLAAPYNQQIAVGWAAVLLAAAAVVVTGVQVSWSAILRPLEGVLSRLSAGSQFILSAITSVALLLGMFLTFGDGTPALLRRDAMQLGVAIVLSGGLLALELPFVIVIAAVLILFVLIYNRLALGLVLALFYAPFFMFPVELWLFAFPVTELLLLITAAAWGLTLLNQWGRVRQSANPQYPALTLYGWLLRLHPLDWCMVAWVGLGLLSLLWAQYRSFAVTELRTLILEPALFYAIFRTVPLTRRDLERLIAALLAAGLVVSLIGLFLYFRCLLLDVCVSVIEAEGGSQRLASVYGSPNNVALLLGRCIPFVLAFTLIPRQQPFVRDFLRLTAGFTLLVMLVTVLLTQSVGALLLGVPVGVITVVVLVYGRRAWLPIGGMLAFGSVGIVLLTQISERFANLLLPNRGTNFFRLRLWESSLEILRDHPITGLGLDQFLYVYSSIYVRPDAIYDRELSHPHNFLLDFWLRLGLAGAALFVVLQVIFWRTLYRLYQHFAVNQVFAYTLVIGLMGSMAALLAHGLIDNSVYVADLALIFAFQLGLSLRLTNVRSIDGHPN